MDELIQTISTVAHEDAIVSNEIICRNCAVSTQHGEKFCVKCGFPVKGTEEEQKLFLDLVIVRKMDLEEAMKKIKSSQNYLYLLAALTFVYGCISYFTTHSTVLTIVDIILACIYIGLADWTKRKPFAAILSAMILYLTVNLLNAFFSPVTIIQGIIFKVAIIALLVKGLRASMEAEKIQKRLNIQ